MSSEDGTERYIEYLGSSDWAKVEENPFNEGELTCMLLTGGRLHGRKLSPDQARELADHLEKAADRAESRSIDAGTGRNDGGGGR